VGAPLTGNGRTAGAHRSVTDQVLGLPGAHWQWPGVKMAMRRSRGGARRSMGSGGEVARCELDVGAEEGTREIGSEGRRSGLL
jgi:hypothetical protein